MIWRRRHERAWDMTRVADPRHKAILQDALNNCDYPFRRITRNTGKKVPVIVSDLSRFIVSTHGNHDHIHAPEGEAHALTGELPGPEARRAALGLYWLPTPSHPAGRVEIHKDVMNNPDLAKEVFLAEAAHAVDYGVPLTDEQRKKIFAAYHGGDESAHEDHGWFEEKGGKDYWSWVGESFMAGFMRAFAPTLARPLEKRQPWKHPTTDEIAAEIRKILK